MQTSYTRQKGFPGMRADSGIVDVKTFGAADDIPMGCGFMVDSNGRAALIPAAADIGKFAGIALSNQQYGNKISDNPYPFFAENDSLAGMIRGRIYALVEEDVAQGSEVFLRVTATADFPAGIFSGKTGEGRVKVPNLTFLSAAEFDFTPPTDPTKSPTQSAFGHAIIQL